jgi:hypothetical protein
MLAILKKRVRMILENPTSNQRSSKREVYSMWTVTNMVDSVGGSVSGTGSGVDSPSSEAEGDITSDTDS